MLITTWILLVLLLGTMVFAVVRVGAEPRDRTVTEPVGTLALAAEEVPHDGRASAARAPSGSVTGLYRHHSAAYYAWRLRQRTRQLQAARRRIEYLKHQIRERHTSSRAVGLNYWIGRQIWAANQIGGHGTDPWPNCPDPFDGGGSWQDTVNCENGGNWLDSPGFYRCGLQFDPMWERKYGRLCP